MLRSGSIPPRPLLLALLGSLVLAPACTEDGTEIMLSIATDMRVPLDLDSIRIELVHVARKVTHDYSLDPAKAGYAKLPATLGLVAGSHSSQPILITVTGKKGGVDVVTRRAQLPWLEGRILLLRMNLLRSCASLKAPCPGDQTCTEGGCQKIKVDPETLPPYTPELAHVGLDLSIPDGALDGSPDSKPADAGPGEVMDGPVVDAAMPDAAKPDAAKPDAAKPDQTPPPKPGTWVTVNKSPPAIFQMGALTGDVCAKHTFNEDKRSVTLTNKFEIYNTEVTQAEFVKEMKYTPKFYNQTCGTNCPAESLAIYEAMLYCNALSNNASPPLSPCYADTGSGKTCAGDMDCAWPTTKHRCINKKCMNVVPVTKYSGKKFYNCPGYRLPTEAEWEYAYRAGTTTAYYNNYNGNLSTCYFADAKVNDISWNTTNSNSSSKAVGGRTPNAWGLYDMAGNVHEYTQDVYVGNLGTAAVIDPLTTGAIEAAITIRGGSFLANTLWVRAAYRAKASTSGGGSTSGFRCVRTLP